MILSSSHSLKHFLRTNHILTLFGKLDSPLPCQLQKSWLYSKATVSILLLLVFLQPLQIYAAEHTTDSDNDTWKTIRTDSIQIHFRQSNESAARMLAAVYALYIPIFERTFEHTPDRIDVVLRDQFDISNGSSTPIPHNTNTIFLSPPIDGSLISQQTWLDLVSRHELTHLYHLDAASGVPNTLRSIFGRLIFLFPAIFQGNWALEGIATYQETDQRLGYGRGSSGYFDAIMRLELEKGFRSISSVTYNSNATPRGVSYYYGYYFFEFLHVRYGSEIIASYINSFNDRIIPFRVNSQSKNIFGFSIQALWKEYQKYLQEKFSTQTQKITVAELSQSKVSDDNQSLQQNQPAYDDAGNLYYFQRDGYSLPVIRRQSANNGERTNIVEVSTFGFGYFDVLGNGDIVYTHLNKCGDRYYYDIYIQPHASQNSQRLAQCQRYKFIRWHPNGKFLFASRYASWQSELVMLDRTGKKISTLLTEKGNAIIGTFAVSPDSRQLVVSLFRPEHGWELYRIDRHNQNAVVRLTSNNNDIEIHPAFSKDGKHILFTSNQGGVYNIHRLENSDIQQKQETLTNVLSAAFSVAAHPDNTTISYSQLHHKGYKVHQLAMQPREGVSIDTEPVVEQEQPDTLARDLLQPVTEKATDYSAFNNYTTPSWWLPLVSSNSVTNKFGLLISGQDQLANHVYQLQLTYASSSEHPKLEGFEGSFQYSYSDWLTIQSSSKNKVFLYNYHNNASLYETNLQTSMVLSLDVYFHKQRQSILFFGLIRDRVDIEYEKQSFSSQTKDVGSLLLIYSDERRYYYNHESSEGSSFYLLTEAHRLTTKQYSSATNRAGNAYGIQLTHNFNLTKAHTVSLRYIQAVRDDSLAGFRLGGTSNTQTLSMNKSYYGFPGYNEGEKGLITNRFQLVSLSYILPLSIESNGFMAPPVGLGGKYLKFYGQAVSIDDPVFNDQEQQKIYANLVAEFHSQLSLGLDILRIPFRFYYAHGIDKNVGSKYVGLETSLSF